MASSEPDSQGELSLPLRIEAQREKLQDIIAPGFGLTVKLSSWKVLTSRERSLIDAKETTFDKNKFLLDFILKSGKCEEFVRALRESGQTHVANFIDGNGVYKPEFGNKWPLREKEVDFLTINLESLVEMLDMEHGFFDSLLSKKVISPRQMEYIRKRPTSFDSNEAFLEILKHSSVEAYNLAIIGLRESGQEGVSKLFEEGGALLPIHATQEGDSVDEVEEHLVNEFTKCLENVPSLDNVDEDRLLNRMRSRIIAVKKGKSIVLFVSCYTVEEFQQFCAIVDNNEMKKILQKLFNLILQNLQTKVLLVTIYEHDKENAEKLFKRELLRDKKYDEHFQRLRSQMKYEPMEVTIGESIGKSEEEEMAQESDEPSASASVEEPVLFGSGSQSPEERKKFSGTGTQAVADEDTIPAIIRNNYEFFKENISPKNLIPKLSSLEILTDNNKRFISTLKSSSDKNHEILNVIRGSSVKNYYEFIKCLRETEQGVVADVAEKGGVTVKMKIVHEPIENIVEIENEIVTKLNQLHETNSPKSEDLWRLLSQLKIGGIEILSACYDKGIVAWIWCRSSNAIAKLEKLSKDKKLGNLFGALFRCLPIPTVPKINDVLWENPDVDVVNRKLCKWSVKTSATMTGLKISGIAMMGNKIIAVFQNRSSLLVFSCDEDGNAVPQKEEPLKNIDTPMHMAASINLQCLYITDRASNKIYKVNIDQEGKVDEPIPLVDESSSTAMGEPSSSSAEQINSLSLGRNDDLLVLKEGKPNRLEIYDIFDKSVYSLKLPGQIKYPHNVAEASNGDFVISYRSDLTPGGICRITRSGDWVARLDLGFKSRPIQGLPKEEKAALSSLSEGIPYLKHLDHFTLDDEDQVYACDADQYVVFLDSELNMEEAIEVEDMKNPYRIHYLKNKKELLLVHGTDQDSFSLLCPK